MAVRLSALRAAALYPQEDSWYSFLLEAESTPRAIVRLEGLGQFKNPMTLSGFEPATFRLVAYPLERLVANLQFSAYFCHAEEIS
jgi:hypothetical protein